MAFSEAIVQNESINNQIEAALESSNAELKDLKILVVDSNKLKWTITARWINQNQEITEEHITNILDKNKNKSRNDIYETGKGAGVTFAVQYALQEMWYTPWTIDGIMGNQTKTAVKEFQKDWNKKNPSQKIAEDGLAGWITLGRMSWAIMNPDWKTRVPVEWPSTTQPETPENESSEKTEKMQVGGVMIEKVENWWLKIKNSQEEFLLKKITDKENRYTRDGKKGIYAMSSEYKIYYANGESNIQVLESDGWKKINQKDIPSNIQSIVSETTKEVEDNQYDR